MRTIKPLTLFVLKADNGKELDNTIDSFGDVIEEIVLLDNRNLEKAVKKCKTEWYGYVFSDECLEKDLTEALPLYFNQKVFDVIVLLQRQVKGDNIKFYQSPRLFKRKIKLKGMVPLKNNYNFVRALDGFLEMS